MTIATYPPAVNGSTASAVLGYAANETTGLDVTTETTIAQVTVYVPAGRTVKVTAYCEPEANAAGDRVRLTIYEDGVGVQTKDRRINASGVEEELSAERVLYPAAGVHTYSCTLHRAAGTGTALNIASAARPSFILVEDITGGTGGPGPIVLGHTKVPVGNQTGITTETAVSGMSVTVHVPAGRTLRISARGGHSSTVNNDRVAVSLREGSAWLGFEENVLNTTYATQYYVEAIETPAAGVHTYQVYLQRTGGTGTLSHHSAANNPAYIVVEDITGTPSPAGILPTSQTLAYAQKTADQGGIASASWVDVTGLAATVTVPDGRRIRVTVQFDIFSSVTGDIYNSIILEDGVAVERGTSRLNNAGTSQTENYSIVRSPSAGTHTYKLQMSRAAGSGSMTIPAAADRPAFILIEDITGGQPAVAPNNVPVGRLAYWEYTGGLLSVGSGAETDVPGAQVNIVVPEGRTIKVTAMLHLRSTVASDIVYMRLREDGNNRGFGYANESTSTPGLMTAVWSPSAGAHTIKVAVTRQSGSGTPQIYGGFGEPAYLLVEDITATPAPANTAPSSTLAYSELSANITGITNVNTDLTSVTVTVPAGRRLKITGHAHVNSSVAGDEIQLGILLDGGEVQYSRTITPGTNRVERITVIAIATPASGAHTITLRAVRSQGSGTLTVAGGAANVTSFLLVEDITGVSVDVHDHNSAPTSTLGYAQKTTDQTGIAASGNATFIEGLSTTVTVPAGRRLRLSAYALMQKQTTTANDYLLIYETTSGSVLLTEDLHRIETVGVIDTFNPSVVITPTAGTHTYSVAIRTSGGSLDLIASPAVPAYLLVEDISGHGIPGHTHPELDEIDDSGWIDLALQNSWVHYGTSFGTAAYRKKNGIVYIRGLVKSGVTGSGTIIATLPPGFRPATQRLFGVNAAGGYARLDITTGGNLQTGTPAVSAAWTSLDGISFPAEQ